jgi:hypothetical protein
MLQKTGAAILGSIALGAVVVSVREILFSLDTANSPSGCFCAAEQAAVIFSLLLLGVGLYVAAAARAVWRDRRRGWIVASISGVALLWLAMLLSGDPAYAETPALWIGMGAAGVFALGSAILRLAASR